MGVFLIFAILFVISLAICIISCLTTSEKARTVNYFYDRETFTAKKEITINSKFWNFFYEHDLIKFIAGVVCVIAFVAIFFTSLISIIEYTRRDIVYQQKQIEYVMLTERLEKDNSEYYLLYSDIVEYNNAVLEDRYWANNKWVNWYHNGKIQYLPLIGEEKE